MSDERGRPVWSDKLPGPGGDPSDRDAWRELHPVSKVVTVVWVVTALACLIGAALYVLGAGWARFRDAGLW